MEREEILLKNKTIQKNAPLPDSLSHLQSLMNAKDFSNLLTLSVEQQVRVVADLYAKRFTHTVELMHDEWLWGIVEVIQHVHVEHHV